MQVFKSKVAIENELAVFDLDTIHYAGEWWLVPGWIDSRDGKQQKPVRLIGVASLAHQESRLPGTKFVVTYPIPKSVLDEGRVPTGQEQKYRLVEAPDIVLPRHVH